MKTENPTHSSSARRLAALVAAFVVLAVLAVLWTSYDAGPGAEDSPAVLDQPFVPSGRTGRFSFLALGDSYTNGEGVDALDRWPMQAAASVRAAGVDLADPAILARTGWTTGDLLRAIDSAPLASQYDCVTLMIGVNNQFQHRPIEEYRAQFQTLLDLAIRLAGGNPQRVIVLSIPDWTAASGMPHHNTGDIDRFNAACQELTSRAGAAWVDVTPISREVAGDDAMFAPDRLHPSQKQYALWTKLAAAAIAATLKEGQPATGRTQSPIRYPIIVTTRATGSLPFAICLTKTVAGSSSQQG
ncbi:MAG TPA: SGNH/GDSL hydrolase family protein [Tepidisphaeraceae bacterium]|jgi:lysophospholipase L1-like esterase